MDTNKQLLKTIHSIIEHQENEIKKPIICTSCQTKLFPFVKSGKLILICPDCSLEQEMPESFKNKGEEI